MHLNRIRNPRDSAMLIACIKESDRSEGDCIDSCIRSAGKLGIIRINYGYKSLYIKENSDKAQREDFLD